jgi:outer membrane protein TolC
MAVIDLRYRGALPFGALALILLPGAAVAQTKPFAGHGRVGARTLVASLDLPEREVSSSPPSVPAKPLVFGEPSVSTSPFAGVMIARPAILPQAPSATARPLELVPGVVVQPAPSGIVPLTLDDAISTALRQNTNVLLTQYQEKYVHGEVLQVGNSLLPTLEFKAYTQTQEINLAAMGFKASTLASISIPGFNPATFSTIVKVNTTDAQLSLSQALFNVPAFYLYKAAKKATEATNWQALNARGGVVIQTAGLYLRTLADQAQVRNAQALLQQDDLVFQHARASRDAGVGINLDVLRAQVQLQTEQQVLVAAQNAVDKDKVMLNRAMGAPAGQQLELVDSVPFAALDGLSVGEAMQVAEDKRKDLRGLEAQLDVAGATEKAVAFQRLPTLGIGGFYGVLGETTGLYHGVFAAEGQLQIPVFQEALQRGQREVARTQKIALEHQIVARRGDIESEIRSSMLDVESSRDLVMVARSNVRLAQQELDDATARYVAGVDDNLPVVEAQATLAGAENQVVQSEFQYNYAKLDLARNTGVVESQYKQYLGR